MALGKRIPNVITSKRSVRACEREEAGIYPPPCSGGANVALRPTCLKVASLHLMWDGGRAGGRLVSVGFVLSTRA